MRPTTCKHFNGHRNQTCEAGVRYDDVTPDPKGVGCACRRPCQTEPFSQSAAHLDEHARRGSCDKLELPSKEDVEAHEKAVQRMMDNFRLSLSLTAKIKKDHKSEDWNGEEECPVCKGRLFIRHSGYNGHTWGKCQTTNCLAWIE